MSEHKFIRATKAFKCKICRHDSWCSYADGLGWVCMRVENSHPTANGGWWHKDSGGPSNPFQLPKEQPVIVLNNLDCERIFSNLIVDVNMMVSFADTINVDASALRYLDARWSPYFNAWAFPMKNAQEKIVGIRLRNAEGRKWAVRGSHQGLFIPSGLHDKTLMICEGPTDTAAALTLGYFAVGRPSAETANNIILEFIRTNKISRAIIVPDNDPVGIRGAEKLQLPIPTITWLPPTKDLRDFLRKGGIREIIDSAIRDMVWTLPKK